MIGDGVNDIFVFCEVDCFIVMVEGDLVMCQIVNLVFLNLDFNDVFEIFFEGCCVVNNIVYIVLIFLIKIIYFFLFVVICIVSVFLG